MIRQIDLPRRPSEVAVCGGLAFRPALGTHGRAALELVDGGDVVAVHVDNAFSGNLLGALRGRDPAGPWALAWGRRPPDGSLPAVAFDGGGPLRRRSRPVAVSALGERFWVACAEGEFRTVTAAVPGRVETWRLVNHGDC